MSKTALITGIPGQKGK